MSSLWTGLGVVVFAGVLQGLWPMGMKKSGPLSWEAFWAPFSFIGMFLLPLIAVVFVFPDLFEMLKELSFKSMIVPLICGLFWGCGSVAFGISVGFVGTSLSFGINMGLGSAIGALIPFFQQGDHTLGSTISFVAAMIATIAGIVMISWAGVIRDRASVQNTKSKGLLRLGFFLAIFAGLATASFNVGYNNCQPLIDIAVAKGYSQFKAGFLPWLVIFWSGFIANVGYAIFLKIKNRTYLDYLKPGAKLGIISVVLTATTWLAAIVLYGLGAGLIGPSGPVIGWIVFLAVSLLTNTVLGVVSGEWKSAIHSQPVLYAGNALLGVSWFFMAFI